MSLALYSVKSKEASKLKSNEIEINIDEDKIINFENTIEPDEMVQFNCVYNKAEIDEKIVGDYLEKNGGLEGFGALNIMAGKGIHTFNVDGTLHENNYATNLNKLYERLKASATNLQTYLNVLKDEIAENIGTAELIPGAELSIIVDATQTKDVDVSSYSKLIAALGNNNTSILSVVDNIYDTINDLDSFTVSEFLNAILQENQTMTSIKENKADEIYEATQENITKYTELVSAIKNLSECLKNILIVEKNLDMKYIKEIKTEKPEEEIPLAVTDEETKKTEYIYTYETANKHADTLTEIINLINSSNENIEKWLKKIEETKTTGIDFTNLNDLKVIQKNTNTSSYEIKPQSITSLNGMITNMSTNNENISNWISNNTIDFNKTGQVKAMEKITNETTNETTFDIKPKNVANFTEFVEATNSTNENVNSFLQQLDSGTITYPDLLDAFGSNVSMCLINERTNEPEICKVQIEITPIATPSPPDTTPAPEDTTPSFVVDPDGNNYKFPTKEQIDEIKEKPTLKVNTTGITIPIYVGLKYTVKGLKWFKNIVYNILSTYSSMTKKVRKNISQGLYKATEIFFKLVFNLFYFIWNIPLKSFAFKALKGATNIIIEIMNPNNFVDENIVDYQDPDIKEVIDELIEITPILSPTKISELAKEGYQKIKIKYTSFKSFWNNIGPMLMDFMSKSWEIYENIINAGSKWIDETFYPKFGANGTDILQAIFGLIIMGITLGIAFVITFICIIFIGLIFTPIINLMEYLVDKFTRNTQGIQLLEDNNYDLVDPDGNKIVITLDDNMLDMFRQKYNDMVLQYKSTHGETNISSDSCFTIENGHPNYYVKSKDLST
ncbi:hypothetical protein M9Y10_025982, partial [Tritrichomonas musculus]